MKMSMQEGRISRVMNLGDSLDAIYMHLFWNRYCNGVYRC